MRTYSVLLICIGLTLGKKAPKRSADDPFTLTLGSSGSGSGSSSSGSGGCVYKGQTYSQGQTWKDGCDYNCQCTDGSVGRYQCRSVCPQYTNLPAQCTLVKDANGCCSTPQCNFQSSGGAGSGSGTSGSGGSGTGTFTLTQTGSGSCTDKLSNCPQYGRDVCTNSNYATWVHDNCCAYCGGSSSSGSSSGTGSQTGGMTGSGAIGSGSSGSGGDPFQLVFQTQAPGTISGSGSGSGSGSCTDRLSNCPQYGRDVCTNSNYATWVHDNCCAYCAGGSSGSSSSGTSGTGSSGSGTSGSGGDPFQLVFQTQAPGTISGSGTGSSSCADSLSNCAAYTKATCTDPNYDRWVRDHCPKYCNKCGSLTGTGSGSGTGTGSGGTSGTGGFSPVAQPGRVITGYGPVSGGGTGTMTGGTGTGTGGTGTGTMPGGTGGNSGSFTFTNCMDKSTSCSLMESQNRICSTASARVYAQQNCAKTCNMCSGTSTGTGGTMTGTGTGGTMTGTGTGGTMTGTGTGGTMTGTGTGTCRDSIPNCKDYTQAVCTNSNYATWVSKNCPAYCNKCSSMSGGGTMTGTGTGSGTMTGTGTVTGTGGTVTGTGTGTGGGISGQSTGCVYKSKIYQQGQTWKDACQYSCSCTNASTGQYQCKSLCVTWNLPSACHMSPPGPGKCCPTPSCPAGYNIQYPAGYVAN